MAGSTGAAPPNLNPRKWLMNSAGSLVTDAIDGLLEANAGLVRLDAFPDIKVVLRSEVDRSKVSTLLLLPLKGQSTLLLPLQNSKQCYAA